MRVLTWNLFHGRSTPPAKMPLLHQFARRLASWEWDVALLQEVPPWWPAPLAAGAQAEHRAALTSRNSLSPLRRAIGSRWPDLAKSNAGGGNAIVARVPIIEHRVMRLRTWPERRVAQLARLRNGVCIANYHGSARPPLAREELARLWKHAQAFAGEAPVLLGGDLNLRDPRLEGATLLARNEVDFLFARGLSAIGEGKLLDRSVVLDGRELELSDHVALATTVSFHSTWMEAAS
jgi:endonuclease/exonuclease/phosphatase family metal-dependent hydrolase